jgi:prolyl-tRNA editing enzyme YbaK/EbsC (Cys-tRNA(Pro) deacylase)
MDLVVRPVIMREALDSAPNSGVPPLGLATQMRVFIDPDLLQYDEVWAAAGTWNDVFAINPASLAQVCGGVVVDLRRNG